VKLAMAEGNKGESNQGGFHVSESFFHENSSHNFCSVSCRFVIEVHNG
jgi:hypothetical protein